MYVDFPFHLDACRRTASTDADDHIRDLVEQVLFTQPGERVGRPDFGAGVDRLLFGSAGAQGASTSQGVIQGALQQWLGDRIRVERVAVTPRETTAGDSLLSIEIIYTRIADRTRAAVVVETPLEASAVETGVGS